MLQHRLSFGLLLVLTWIVLLRFFHRLLVKLTGMVEGGQPERSAQLLFALSDDFLSFHMKASCFDETLSLSYTATNQFETDELVLKSRRSVLFSYDFLL
jgi:hypothetical protein